MAIQQITQDHSASPITTIKAKQLLCVRNTAELGTSLIELDVSTNSPASDEAFFKLLKDTHEQSQRSRSFLHRWIWSYAVTDIRFVQFELQHDNKVAVQVNDCLPPRTECHEYSYTQMNQPPRTHFRTPLSKDHLLRYFQDPEEVDAGTLIYSRVPKKVGSRLTDSKYDTTGWGVQLVDEKALSTACWAALASLVGALILGLGLVGKGSCCFTVAVEVVTLAVAGMLWGGCSEAPVVSVD